MINPYRTIRRLIPYCWKCMCCKPHLIQLCKLPFFWIMDSYLCRRWLEFWLLTALQTNRYFSTGSAFKVSTVSVQSRSKTTANTTEKGRENDYLCRLWQGLLEGALAMQLLLQFFLAMKRKQPSLWDVGNIFHTHYTSVRRHVCISSLPNMSNLNTQSINKQVYIWGDLVLPCLYQP